MAICAEILKYVFYEKMAKHVVENKRDIQQWELIGTARHKTKSQTFLAAVGHKKKTIIAKFSTKVPTCIRNGFT